MINEKWFRILCAVLGIIGLIGLYFYWWTENLFQNLFVMAVCIWLNGFGLKPWLTLPNANWAIAPNASALRGRESRDDFFRCVQSLESENVNVSAGELLAGREPMDACLIQVGLPGHYT